MSDAAYHAGARARVALVYSLFFLSGLAALVYEVSWSRMVGIALGLTAQAAALVLASCFTGLAIGHWLGGELARRVSPLRAYGVAEMTAAAWACLIPSLLKWIGTPASSGGPAVLQDSPGGRATLCFLVLLPATISMGATLPMVVETLAVVTGSRSRGPFAYGLNTAGGLLGVVATSAFLPVTLGVVASNFLAAALSAACGLTACVSAPHRRDRPRLEISEPTVDDTIAGAWGWAVLAAISGFGTLGLEVLYTRMFALVFHNSTYTFGAVVAAFLLALSLGSALASRFGQRSSPRLIAMTSFSLGGIALAVSVASFPRLTGLDYFTFGGTFAAYLAGAFGLVALFVLPPVTLLGMTFPAAIRAAAGTRAVGRVAAVNAIAAAAGSVAAGFVLPPRFGLWPAFAAFVALFSVTGAVMLARERKVKLASAFALVTATAAVIVTATTSVDEIPGVDRIQRWESAYGWVDVVCNREDGSLAVRQNLHYHHGSTANALREYRQGRLPLLLHGRPGDVAFLGLGTGLTAAPAVADRDVERAVIIELIPQVVDAARLLASANLGAVDHPKVEVRVDDARHHLLRTERRFDAIVSDLFVPWEGSAGYLYSVEFYQTVRHRLKPGGLFCQWIALYQVGPEQFELIADSFSSAFPHTTIWWGQLNAQYPIVALLGGEEPLTVDRARLDERWDAVAELPGGADPDLRIPSDLPALYIGAWIRDPTRKLNTDEHPRLEFTAPVSHRSARTLRGPALQRYFDDVLSRLPPGELRLSGELDAMIRDDTRRRALQRLSLFGDVNP